MCRENVFLYDPEGTPGVCWNGKNRVFTQSIKRNNLSKPQKSNKIAIYFFTTPKYPMFERF